MGEYPDELESTASFVDTDDPFQQLLDRMFPSDADIERRSGDDWAHAFVYDIDDMTKEEAKLILDGRNYHYAEVSTARGEGLEIWSGV